MGYHRHFGLWAGSAVVALVSAVPAQAQNADMQRFDIPAGDVTAASDRLRGMGYTVTLAGGAAGTTRAVAGMMTVRDAVDAMLAGTGLDARWSGGALTIRSAQRGGTVDGREIGVVRVAGEGTATGGGTGATGIAQRGANGSSDETATERTRSYAPPAIRIGGKIPRTLKETPQTVSVVTRQQIEDQQLNTLTDVLEATPGVTVLQLNNANQFNPQFYSRGFEIRNFQIDGGAPINYGSGSDYGSQLTPSFDMSKYDNVAVLRGADGINAGVGDPGGTLSLERKRPVATAQLNQEYTAGSWDAVRASVDLSQPLARGVALRLVGTHDQRDYFYRIANRTLDMVYANLEYHPDDATRLNVGTSYTQQSGVPFGGGLPRYADGGDLRLPRETCLCAPYANFKTREWEVFAQGERRFGNEWSLNANLNTIRQRSRNLSFSYNAFSGVDRATGRIENPSFVGNSRNSLRSIQYTADVFVNGAFELFGHRQTVVAGFNHQRQEDRSATRPGDGTAIFPPMALPIVDFDPAAFPLQGDADFTPNSSETPRNQRIQSAVYGSLQLEPVAGLHLSGALRYNWYRTDQVTIDTFPGLVITRNKRLRENRLLPPTVSAGYDVTARMRVYASYAGIFQTNADKLTADRSPLAPTTGRTIEGGIKRTDNGGRLTSSIAYFDTLQNNLSDFDTSVPIEASDPTPSDLRNGTSCCYVTAGSRRSKGVDASVAGALTARWQLSLGYTYNTAQFKTPTIAPRLIVSQQPKHLVKLLTSYRLGSNGLAGMTTVGASGRFQTRTTTSDTDANFRPVVYSQPSYALADLFVRMAFTPALSLQVNVDNLLDKRYYATIGGLNQGSFYGAPRNVSVALRARF